MPGDGVDPSGQQHIQWARDTRQVHNSATWVRISLTSEDAVRDGLVLPGLGVCIGTQHKLSTQAGPQREYKDDADEPHRTYYARSSVASGIGRVALSRLTNGTLFAYASGSIGTGAFYAFNNF